MYWRRETIEHPDNAVNDWFLEHTQISAFFIAELLRMMWQ
jgi:hypothetical protein